MGRDAGLPRSLQAASVWPDPNNTTEGIAACRRFFNIALNGGDQLRQRASFALAQILVAQRQRHAVRADGVVSAVYGGLLFRTYRACCRAPEPSWVTSSTW